MINKDVFDLAVKDLPPTKTDKDNQDDAARIKNNDGGYIWII